ncbi:MAG: hypothetical protein AAF726_08965 [Planctomycetota bacterium]
MKGLFIVLVTAIGLASTARAEDTDFPFDDLGIVVHLAGLDDVEATRGGTGGWILGRWSATFEGVPLRLELGRLDRERFGFNGPDDVVRTIAFNRGNRAREKGTTFRFDESRALEGSFGYVPYGWFAVHHRSEGTRTAGHDIVIAGMTEAAGYALEIRAEGPFDDEALSSFEAWARGSVTYSGETMVPEWTEEEAEARWADDAPDDLLDSKRRRIIRTDHYILFTDLGGSSARGFAKKLDENYERVRAVFPFTDVPGQRLLPVFYFNDRENYCDWWVKNLGGSRENAMRSGGVASGDVYATYAQSANAPVHIHEQTHQIFRNRLRLAGGGSWFQEGVAEYMSSKPGELGEIKRLAKKGRLTPMEEFFVVPSLLMSSGKEARKEGGSQSGLAYTYAAAIVEFAKHSKFGRERFLDWVDAIGSVARGDLPAIERATADVYGVTIGGFEEAFTAYWSKRRTVRDWHAPAETRRR